MITDIYEIPPVGTVDRQVIAIKCISKSQILFVLKHLAAKGYIFEGKIKSTPCFVTCRLDIKYLYLKRSFITMTPDVILLPDYRLKYLI